MVHRMVQVEDAMVPTAAPTLNTDDDEKDTLEVFSAVVSNVLLFFLIFGLSATVRIQDLRHQLSNKFAILTGVAMQFLIMPFLGFCSVMIFRDSGFTEAMGISLLVVTASPGGSYSNWWCSLFNAELALSVAMTSVSSILSLGLLPANLFFYSWLAYEVIVEPDEGDEDLDVVNSLDYQAIFIALGVVLGAILLGLYVGYKWNSPTFHKRANAFGSFCGLALILFSAFLGSGAGDSDTNFWSLPWSFYVGTALPCILGMALANIISRSFRLSPPEVVAISIECCYQNTAIATSVAVTMFSDPDDRAEAISVPLFYGLIEAIIIGIYCLWAWKVGWTKAPADEKLCVVVTKTYEVGPDHGSPEEDWEELPHGWVARLFVPREVERQHLEGGPAAGSGSGSKLQQLGAGKDVDDQQVEGAPSRDRCESADITVATCLVTPPGTPEVSLETIPQEKEAETRFSEDLEAPPSEEGQEAMLHADGYDGYPSDEQSLPSSAKDLTTDIDNCVASVVGMTGLIKILPSKPSQRSQPFILPAGPSQVELMDDDGGEINQSMEEEA